MNKLIFANLLHRPVRSIISVLAVAIEVVMILSIVGIFMGMLNDQKQRTNGIGADLMLRPNNASIMNGVGGAPMPAKNIEAIRRLPHVAVASPVIQHLNTEGKIEVLAGIEYSSYNALKPFVFLSGGPFQGPNDVIIDDIAASADGGLHVGQTIPVMDGNFRICGIVENGCPSIPWGRCWGRWARLRCSISGATTSPTRKPSSRRFTRRRAWKTTRWSRLTTG